MGGSNNWTVPFPLGKLIPIFFVNANHNKLARSLSNADVAMSIDGNGPAETTRSFSSRSNFTNFDSENSVSRVFKFAMPEVGAKDNGSDATYRSSPVPSEPGPHENNVPWAIFGVLRLSG
jgi:hypothetical protein